MRKDLSKQVRKSPFYVDAKQPGVVRGGWLDELGGFLIGVEAETVAGALNIDAMIENDDE